MARRILVGNFNTEVLENPSQAYKYASAIIEDHFYGSDYNVVSAAMHYHEGRIESIRFGSFENINKDVLNSALDAGFKYIDMVSYKFVKCYEEGHAVVSDMIKLMK